jgi:hypothetical protein
MSLQHQDILPLHLIILLGGPALPPKEYINRKIGMNKGAVSHCFKDSRFENDLIE